MDRCKSQDQKEIVQAAIDAMRLVTIEAINEGHDVTKPMRRYIRSLAPDDTVSVAEGQKMTKREARAQVPAPVKPEDTIYMAHCDGQFDLLGVDLHGDDHPVLLVAQGGVTVKAFFFERVSEKVKEEILNAIEAGIDSGAPASMALQAECAFSEKSIKYCIIRGAEAPRDEMRHYGLQDIPDKVKAKDRRLPGFD